MRGLILLCAALVGSAQAQQALRLSTTDRAPVIDGSLDEPVWQRAPLFDRFVQLYPEDKRPARWHTTVQLLASQDALIFGIRAFDPAPDQIRAPLSRRDQVRRDQDFIGVVIDPVGQRRSAQFVRVSAAGVLADGVYTAEDDVEDFAPDFDLEAAVKRLPDGYSVELRWPLAALRFPHAKGAPWRLMVTRSIPRDDASVLNVSVPLSKDALSFIAELQVIEGLGDLVEQVRDKSFVSVRPELTWRSGQKPSLGAELKWRPRADWVIDATLKPDFSQVELDAPQLAGNTRFALSLPEKRPFFLESSDVVGQSQPDESGENRSLAAFYSRAITDPDWGLRATWRGATAEATVLSLRDAGGGLILRPAAYATARFPQRGASQASFMRGRAQLPMAVSLGALASSRRYGNGRSNEVIGSDLAWHASDIDLLRGHLLLSRTTAGFNDQAEPLQSAAESGHQLWLGWRQRDEDWNNTVHLEEVSPRFANDNGFVSQSGYRRATLQLNRRLGASQWAALPVYELEAQLHLVQTQTLADAALGVPGGEVIDRQLQPGFWFATARNSGIWGHLGLDRQRVRSGGTLHAPRTLTLGGESNPSEWLTFLAGELSWGRMVDVEADREGRGAHLSLEAKTRWALPSFLGSAWWLGLEQHWGQGFVRDPLGHRAFTDRTAQSLLVLHFSARDSVRLIHQSTHYTRRADALLLAVDERSLATSLVAQHRIGLSRVLSLGATRSQGFELGADKPLVTEVFAKAMLSFP